MIKQVHLLVLFFVYSIQSFSQESQDTCIDLFFEVNSFKPDSHQYNKLKAFLDRYSKVTQITGFADTTGKANYNLVLSQQRAEAVNDIVNVKFDSPEKIVLFYGESKVLPELWMNRRVQICAYKPEQEITSENAPQKETGIVRKIDLDNIYFIPDKPILSQESVTYIEELANQLKSFPTSRFEIIGHINYQSRFDSTHLQDLYELSRLRAKAVYDYLIEFGIPAARMSYKGVGNSQPVFVAPKNDEEKRRNMRVEVIIKN